MGERNRRISKTGLNMTPPNKSRGCVKTLAEMSAEKV